MGGRHALEMSRDGPFSRHMSGSRSLFPAASAQSPHLTLRLMEKPLWIHGWFHPFHFWEDMMSHTESMYADAHCADMRDRPASYVASLKVCSMKKDLLEGSRLHAEIHACGLLKNNTLLGNMLLTMYAKCGAPSKAEELLHQLPCRDVVSWNVLIAGYSESGQGEKALNAYDSMQREGICPDSITYACTLKACGITKRVDRGRQIHEKFVDQELLGLDTTLGNSLIDMYAKCGMLLQAQQVLDKLLVRDVVSWNALMAGYVQHMQYKKAVEHYEGMQKEGTSPDAFTYVCILKAFGFLREVDKGRRAHSYTVIKGLLERSNVLGNALVDMYAKCGVLSEAHKVLDRLPIRDVVSWSALIAGYIQKGRAKEALDCYERMRDEGLSPDAITYSCILKACGLMRLVDRGKQIHNGIAKQGLLKRNAVLGTALIDMYCKCGLPLVAAQVLDELPVRNVISWSALITGYVQQGQGEEALDCFQQMRNEGMHPDAVTYACILKACGITNEVGRGKQIHDEIANQGILDTNIVLGTALVDMYAKCGVLAKAVQVLEELPNRNVVSWNALIAGYAQQGKGNEALDCFQQMRHEGLTPNRVSWNAVIGGYAQQGQAEKALGCFHRMQHEGISPDSITFISMLNACSHSGLVEEGQTYFENMKRDHGILPELEHHTCLVSLFARTGHFDKAMTVISKLPSFDYLPVWSALLSACQKWDNMKLGALAFQYAVHLDKHDAVAYVYMENIYAATGMHKGAQKIAAMRVKNTSCAF